MLKERLIDLFAEMEDSELVSLWNEFCSDYRRYDDRIFDIYELEEMINNDTDSLTWINRFYFGSDDYSESGSANPNRNYFKFDGYANIISFDYIYNSFSGKFNHIDIDDLVDYIIEEDNDFDNTDIRDILDSAETDNE